MRKPSYLLINVGNKKIRKLEHSVTTFNIFKNNVLKNDLAILNAEVTSS